MRRYEAGSIQLELEEPVPWHVHCLVFVAVHVLGPALWAFSWAMYHIRGPRE